MKYWQRMGTGQMLVVASQCELLNRNYRRNYTPDLLRSGSIQFAQPELRQEKQYHHHQGLSQLLSTSFALTPIIMPLPSGRTLLLLILLILILQLLLLLQRYGPPYQGVRNLQAETMLYLHGEGVCFSSENRALHNEADTLRKTCRKYPELFRSSDVRIATLMAHFGQHTFGFEKAIRTHRLHGLVHGFPLHVLCSPVVEELWNKHALILSVLLNEMMKPEGERLEWLMWADRDTMMLDYCRHPASFLPPIGTDMANGTNLIVAEDWNGLNNGVFLIRVNQWSIDFISDTLAFRHFKPEITLKFTEQSAMELVIREKRYRDEVKVVPQHWFNAFPNGDASKFEMREAGDMEELDEGVVRRGDFLVHFAGTGDKEEWIHQWYRMARKGGGFWEAGRGQRDVEGEIREFWGAFV